MLLNAHHRTADTGSSDILVKPLGVDARSLEDLLERGGLIFPWLAGLDLQLRSFTGLLVPQRQRAGVVLLAEKCRQIGRKVGHRPIIQRERLVGICRDSGARAADFACTYLGHCKVLGCLFLGNSNVRFCTRANCPSLGFPSWS